MAPDAHALATLAPQTPAEPRAPAVRLTRTARADWQPAEADPPLAAGAVIDGRYRVVTVIGEGGMGRVYEVEHLFLRRRLAIKLVRRDAGTGEAAARLLQEAVLAGKVPHATVVPVFDCAALPDGQVYVAMELLRGESLEEALLRPQPAEAVLRWLAEVARGLAAAHRAGIVHRDVKPANLFLARANDGTVQPRILDFGLAKLLPGLAGEAAVVQTQAGALMGTPFYMAPERIRGETGDPRADLYGFGVILYEALTGQVPFLGEGFMEIVGRHLREPPLDPRQAAPQRRIPDPLAELALALLRKDPAARPDDGDAVAAALLEVVARAPAIAGLMLGGEGSVSAVAATQAIEEGSTQRLEGHVVADMSEKTAVLAGEAGGAGLAGGASGRAGVAGPLDMTLPPDASDGRAGVAGPLDMTLPPDASNGLAGVAGLLDMTLPPDASGRLAGGRAAELSAGTGASGDQATGRSGQAADLSARAASDMSSGAASASGAGLSARRAGMSSRTGGAATGLRAVALVLACAAGGALAWVLMPPSEPGDVDPAGQGATLPGPPIAPTAGPPVAPSAAEAAKGPPEPAAEAVVAGPGSSGGTTTGDATATSGVDATAGSAGAAAQPEVAAKKRGKKPPRKAGTTEPGPRGTGPKIKTDVYDE
ncbi:serine/threonine-protein kinase [Nannocystis radixulma]|uniref:Protein kinase n=1 Tax=Nannocystis radixulma TaxID=2995305 RepID=A0ABT5B4T1_9BACT|nr:serine/threonine-protein kinase [Nannocystis radixulma]MDC0669124.1 protein kinase [Nannocystis radixulma]